MPLLNRVAGIAYQQTFITGLVNALQPEAGDPQFDPSQAHYFFEELMDLHGAVASCMTLCGCMGVFFAVSPCRHCAAVWVLFFAVWARIFAGCSRLGAYFC